MTIKLLTLILLMPLQAFAARAFMEGIPASNNSLFLSTQNARLIVSATSYDGGLSNVGLYVSSNVVVSNTRFTNKCVIYSTGSLSCANISANVLSGNGVVNVANYATGGSGTEASPWTGWDTAVVWKASSTFSFQNGWYSYATAPNWFYAGITIRGESQQGTILKHTGTGDAISLDGGIGAAVAAGFGFSLSKLRITGNANTRHGIFLRNTHHVDIRDVSVNSVNNSGIYTIYSIMGVLENFKVDVNEGITNTSTTPVNGIVLDGTLATGPTNAWTVINPIVTGVSGTGISLLYAGDCTIVGGDSEGNPYDLRMGTNSTSNNVFNLYTTNPIEEAGAFNAYHGVINATSLQLINGSYTRVIGGTFSTITVNATSQENYFIGVTYGYGVGNFTDNGLRTTIISSVKYGASIGLQHNSILRSSTTVYGLVLSSTNIPSISCNAGTGVITARSTDQHGEFVAGAAAVNCTMTFTQAYPQKPSCWCNNETDIQLLGAIPTTTSLQCRAAASFGGDTIQYGCLASP